MKAGDLLIYSNNLVYSYVLGIVLEAGVDTVLVNHVDGQTVHYHRRDLERFAVAATS